MDGLSEILRTARLTGGVFLRGEFSEPWCLSSTLKASDCSVHLGPTDHLILYHFVLEGRLMVELEDGRHDSFGPGQAVILPRNDPHRLAGQSAATPKPALDAVRIPGPGELMMIEHGGGGSPTRIVCGFLGGRVLGSDPLLAALPSFFRYDSAISPSGPLVIATLDAAAREVGDGRPGSDAILGRISELLFVEAVRHYVEELPEDSNGWLGALHDVSVSKALALFHRDPRTRWTVDDVSRQVGAWRSTLTEKFVRYLGCGPGDYLARLRMQVAARDLLSGRQGIAQIAEHVGYASEAAFSRAFKRHYGAAPSVWRAREAGK